MKTTVIIPIKYDSQDRINNLSFVMYWIKNYLPDSHIVLQEQKDNLFHKTKLINDAARLVTTDYMAIWDADVFMPPHQIHKTLDALNNGYETVYPYDGAFYNVPKSYHNIIKLTHNTNLIELSQCQRGYGLPEVTPDRQSFGGCVFYRTEAFKRCGMANTAFKGYGPEDAELGYRFSKLTKYVRIDGPLFHLDHIRLTDSQENHMYVSDNNRLLQEILKKTKQELKDYANYLKSYNNLG